MNAISPHHKLRRLVGERFRYVDRLWVMVEVLQDTDRVVLQPCTDCGVAPVQGTAFGLAGRRVSQTLSLRISDASGQGYSDDLLLLLEGRERPDT
jgi:hypothetical protein